VKIFISHNAKDKDMARLLATMFTDRGVSVWFDSWEIKPGERFLQLVANQFPATDEVRSLFCPVCGSKNLSAQVKHEPQFDERLYVVRCADCEWQQQAKGDFGWRARTASDVDEEA
jgi:hypothetical protein